MRGINEDMTLDELLVYYDRAHKMGASDVSRRTTALQTKELLEELVALRAKSAADDAKLAFIADKVKWLKLEFTANIPLGPPDREYDPNDEFKRCAVDRSWRVSEFASKIKTGLKNIDAGVDPE
jgi:hypothetical protein